MKLSLSTGGESVVVSPESSKERKILEKFPGLLKTNNTYYFPARVNICKNLVTRLKRLVGVVNGTKEVLDLYNQEFRLKDIPSSFKYFTTPLRHQEIALRFLYTNGGGGLLLDPGLGKTKVVLDFIKLMGFGRSLIVCPKALLFVWQDEVAVHRPDLRIHVRKSMTWDVKIRRTKEKISQLESREELSPSSEEKLSRYKSVLKKLERDYLVDMDLGNKADIVVINYEKCIQGEIELEEAKFDFMAIDEGLVKDPSTNRTQSITRLSRSIPCKVIMSGTLVNNTPEDVFAPLRIMEPCLVGGSVYKFKDEYCIQASVKDEAGDIKSKFTVGHRNLDEIKGILQCVSIVMRKEEWLDLPEKKFKEIVCTPSNEQIFLSNELAANYITKIGDEYLEVESPLTVMAKLYQISNGFVYMDDSRDDMELLFGQEPKKASKKDRRTVLFKDNPKVDALRNLCLGDLAKRKFILWYNMDAEYEVISSLLKNLGISYLSIRGGEKRTGEKVKEFNANPDLQALVCQAKSVNYGITVLGTTPEKLDSDIEILPDIDPRVFTEVFFSLNFSLEVFLQQQDRIHRIGQTHEVEYYILINDTPVERKISSAISRKVVLRNHILEDFLAQIREGLVV